MTRKPGALGGRVAGDPEMQARRGRRIQQKQTLKSGDQLGAGLKEDERGRMAVDSMTYLDPMDPEFRMKLIALLREHGFME